MVLAELGEQITKSFQKLFRSQLVDETLVNELLKEVATALLISDVNVRYVAQLRDNVKARFLASLNDEATEASKKRLFQKLIVDELTAMVKSSRQPFKPKRGKSNVIMFVGLQGSGKTTTVAKIANYYRRKQWTVGLVCADTFRAGAFDQLKQNAAKVGVPFYGSYTEADPVKIGLDGVRKFRDEKFDIILVDTSGRHKQENALFEEMQQMATAIDPDDVVFILDSHIGQACYDQAKAFSDAVTVGSVVITKLDGHAKGGGALSAVSATNSPIVFLGVGEHFDELEPFEPQGFIQRLLGMGDITGLFNTISEAGVLEKGPEMFTRMMQGNFTLRDMRSQMDNILKMGSISRLMSMIPGMKDVLMKGSEEESMRQIKQFMVIMDSMSARELDSKKINLTERRLFLIARGSGHTVNQVRALLDRYRELSKAMTQMTKMGSAMQGRGGRGGMPGNPMDLARNLMKNPAAMQNMQSMLPGMLKRLGGGAGPDPDMMREMMNQMNFPFK